MIPRQACRKRKGESDCEASGGRAGKAKQQLGKSECDHRRKCGSGDRGEQPRTACKDHLRGKPGAADRKRVDRKSEQKNADQKRRDSKKDEADHHDRNHSPAAGRADAFNLSAVSAVARTIAAKAGRQRHPALGESGSKPLVLCFGHDGLGVLRLGGRRGGTDGRVGVRLVVPLLLGNPACPFRRLDRSDAAALGVS